jgi:CheY-like chemotaxis protein
MGCKKMKTDISRQKLLIIDDDDATRLLITEIFEETNVTIIECESGKKAISLFKQHCDDIVLVLLDIRLPGCSGWELLKLFRKEKPLVPAIAISATAPSELAHNCKAAGFNAFVSKPFDMNEFVETVNEYL